MIARVASPDGRRAVSAGLDHTLQLWDVETGRELSRAEGQSWFHEAALSFNGTLAVASGGAKENFEQSRWFEVPDERVRLYRVVTTRDETP